MKMKVMGWLDGLVGWPGWLGGKKHGKIHGRKLNHWALQCLHTSNQVKKIFWIFYDILNMIIGGLQNFTISLIVRFPTWSSDVQNFGLMGLLMGPALQLSFSIRDDLRDDRSFHFSCWGFVRSGNSKTGSFDLCPCIDLKEETKSWLSVAQNTEIAWLQFQS